jgi:hypothetical protein
VGLQWVHAMREHEHMLTAVLTRLGLEPVIKITSPNVWAAAYRSAERTYLFLLNLFTQPIEVEVETDGLRWRGTVEPVTVKVIQ